VLFDFSRRADVSYFLPPAGGIVCEQALRGDLAVGREKEGELATTSLEFEFRHQRSCGSPLSELSGFGKSAQTRNELQCNKHV